jgi:hypothetical protein
VFLHWIDTVTAINDKLLVVARHSSIRSNVLSVQEFFKLPNYRHLINSVFKYRILPLFTIHNYDSYSYIYFYLITNLNASLNFRQLTKFRNYNYLKINRSNCMSSRNFALCRYTEYISILNTFTRNRILPIYRYKLIQSNTDRPLGYLCRTSIYRHFPAITCLHTVGSSLASPSRTL